MNIGTIPAPFQMRGALTYGRALEWAIAVARSKCHFGTLFLHVYETAQSISLYIYDGVPGPGEWARP